MYIGFYLIWHCLDLLNTSILLYYLISKITGEENTKLCITTLKPLYILVQRAIYTLKYNTVSQLCSNKIKNKTTKKSLHNCAAHHYTAEGPCWDTHTPHLIDHVVEQDACLEPEVRAGTGPQGCSRPFSVANVKICGVFKEQSTMALRHQPSSLQSPDLCGVKMPE